MGTGLRPVRSPEGDENRPKAQRIHHRHRPRAHGENIAQDSAHSGGRALKRLDERRMIVGLDLESAGPAIADVDDARILTRPLHHEPAARRQPLQVHPRRFVGAVLAPHHAEDAKFGERGLASAQQLLDFFVFVGREAVLPDDLGSKEQVWRKKSYGVGILLSHSRSRLESRRLLVDVSPTPSAGQRPAALYCFE